MNSLKKFVKSTSVTDYEVLTDTGWENIVNVHETVPYTVHELILKSGKSIRCADNHIVFSSSFDEVFVANLKAGDTIMVEGSDGPIVDEVLSMKVLPIQEEMYDLELSNGSNRRYYTNGILSHNSTILRFLADLDKPTSGDVLVNGYGVHNTVRAGMVFQSYSSFPWLTVLDNVALGLKFQGVGKSERMERAMAMIERVGLLGHEKKYASSKSLSGGQLQRVAIARSLVANPQVLLMDEPFGALDPKTRSQMQDLLCSLFEEYKFTIVLVTHDPREAVYLADDIYIMSKPPSTVAHHIKVDLGFHRERSIKRSSAFADLVNKVDDIMMQMDS